MLTVLVPALNEEGNLVATIEQVTQAATSTFDEYEVIIFNDGSTDRTPEIAEKLAENDVHINVVHHSTAMGIGCSYVEGLKLARGQYLLMVPGDNAFPADQIRCVLQCAGQADIVIPFTANSEVRKFGRQILSNLFTTIINRLFSLKVKYYNSIVLHQVDLLKSIPLGTGRFTYQAENLVKLLCRGCSYVHVATEIQEREHGGSGALSRTVIVDTFRSILRLFWDVRIKNRATYTPSPAIGNLENAIR